MGGGRQRKLEEEWGGKGVSKRHLNPFFKKRLASVRNILKFPSRLSPAYKSMGWSK
jgi:hypothetical protein